MGQKEWVAGLADHTAGLNPAYPAWYMYYLGPAYSFADRPTDAARTLEGLPPRQRYEFGWVVLAAYHAQAGHEAEIRAAAGAVRSVSPASTAEVKLTTTFIIARDEDRRRFFEGLQKAGLPVCTDPAAAAGLDPKAVCPNASPSGPRPQS